MLPSVAVSSDLTRSSADENENVIIIAMYINLTLCVWVVLSVWQINLLLEFWGQPLGNHVDVLRSSPSLCKMRPRIYN